MTARNLAERLTCVINEAHERCMVFTAETVSEAVDRIETLEAAIETNTKALGFAQNGRAAAEAEVERLKGELARIRKLDDQAFANWRTERESLWAIRDRYAAAAITAEARVKTLEEALMPFAEAAKLCELHRVPRQGLRLLEQRFSLPCTTHSLERAAAVMTTEAAG